MLLLINRNWERWMVTVLKLCEMTSDQNYIFSWRILFLGYSVRQSVLKFILLRDSFLLGLFFDSEDGADVIPKRRLTLSQTHGTISQKIELFIWTIERVLHPTHFPSYAIKPQTTYAASNFQSYGHRETLTGTKQPEHMKSFVRFHLVSSLRMCEALPSRPKCYGVHQFSYPRDTINLLSGDKMPATWNWSLTSI
jgi:hypothetical protein